MMIISTKTTAVTINGSLARNYGTIRIAIIGSGLAGFYTARQLIKTHSEISVDIFDSSPVPFGLIRFGVAPDHPEVKNVIGRFTRLAESNRFRFFGNVCLGCDVTVKQLKTMYSAIVLANGAGDDKKLKIPGEDLKGVHSAREFVGWYNGVPNYTKLNPNLSGETAVVIGQGNVALDVARILLTPVELLQKTDICSHALDSLSQSNIRRLLMIGRRSPLEVSFSVKEFRRLVRLPQCHTIIGFEDVEKYKAMIGGLPRQKKKMTEAMILANDNGVVNGTTRTCELKFLRSPVEILSSPATNSVQGIKLEINQLEAFEGSVIAVGTGKYEAIECSLVIRSIGYKGLMVDPDIPFNHELNIIPNNAGRVISSNGEIMKGLYCSGWIKRGPAGAILMTMNDAIETAESIIKDIYDGKLLQIAQTESTDDVLRKILQTQGKKTMSFGDWRIIDKEEQNRGTKLEKPREKIVSIKDMLETICQHR